MASDAKSSLLDAALSLPAQDRAELAERLILSLDENHRAEVDAAWIAEIERRFEQLDRGEAKLVSGDEAMELFRRRKKV